MVLNEKVEIVFAGKTPFPASTASSNRILTLGKGLKNAGANVSVYCFGLPKFSTKKHPVVKYGEVEGINYQYTGIGRYSSSYKILRGFNIILGQMIGYYLIYKKYYKKKPIFFTSLAGLNYVIPLWLLTILLKGKLFFFRSEYPAPVLSNSKLISFYESFIYPVSIKKFDGMFIMTRRLAKYFSKWKNVNAFIEITPITVDSKPFNENCIPFIKDSYIAYAGSLSNKKDGVDILIKAFAKIHKAYPDIKLVIIGGGSGLEELQKMSYRLLGSEDKVLFTGLVDYNLIPAYLINAKILALARPNSIQAEGGFPTKVGEYLATGNPVVVTNTGDICYYLKDRINAIIAVPDSVDDFANKLKWTLDNFNIAKTIGLQGKQVSENFFNSNTIGKKIMLKLS
jgi:glycosyltransferase involved in cell wall biosynthesis